jgi:hypothetical protein
LLLDARAYDILGSRTGFPTAVAEMALARAMGGRPDSSRCAR